jgi:hypothetical protein
VASDHILHPPHILALAPAKVEVVQLALVVILIVIVLVVVVILRVVVIRVCSSGLNVIAPGQLLVPHALATVFSRPRLHKLDPH